MIAAVLRAPRDLTIETRPSLVPGVGEAVIRVEGAGLCGTDYRIWNGEVADVFTAETHAHVVQRLDAARMHEPAQALAGTHDFAIFTVLEPEVSSTTRTIESIEVRRDGDAIVLSVTADGFLRYMVRRIAGSLIEIGRGKLAPDAIWTEARWTAPAKGLTLWDVRY